MATPRLPECQARPPGASARQTACPRLEKRPGRMATQSDGDSSFTRVPGASARRTACPRLEKRQDACKACLACNKKAQLAIRSPIPNQAAGFTVGCNRQSGSMRRQRRKTPLRTGLQNQQRTAGAAGGGPSAARGGRASIESRVVQCVVKDSLRGPRAGEIESETACWHGAFGERAPDPQGANRPRFGNLVLHRDGR